MTEADERTPLIRTPYEGADDAEDAANLPSNLSRARIITILASTWVSRAGQAAGARC